MSILNLSKNQTKDIEINGQTFEFNMLSASHLLKLIKLSGEKDPEVLIDTVAEIVAYSITGETVTAEDIKQAIPFDVIIKLGAQLAEAFSSTNEAGKS